MRLRAGPVGRFPVSFLASLSLLLYQLNVNAIEIETDFSTMFSAYGNDCLVHFFAAAPATAKKMILKNGYGSGRPNGVANY